MNGHNQNQDRSKWEREMFSALYEQKLQDEKDRKVTGILNIASLLIILAGILVAVFINYNFGYLLK